MKQNKIEGLLKHKGSVLAISLFCAVLWGSAFPVLKISYRLLGMQPDDISAKLVFAGMRFFLASIFIFIILKTLLRKSFAVRRKDWPWLLLLGILQTSLQYFFFYNGLAHTSGMKGAVLASSGTFFVVILAHFVYDNDRLSGRKWIGLAAGFAGILLVNSNQSFSLSFSWQGEGFLIAAGLVNALATILSKKMSLSIHPFLMTAWQMLIGSSALLLAGLPGLKPHAMSFTPGAWALLIYSAFLSAAAFSLWNSLLKYNKAGEISIYKFMTPVSGAVLSAAIIPQESMTGAMLLALALVAGGIVAVNGKRKRGRKRKLSPAKAQSR